MLETMEYSFCQLLCFLIALVHFLLDITKINKDTQAHIMIKKIQLINKFTLTIIRHQLLEIHFIY